MNKTGWLVNDCLTCIPGSETWWHDMLRWFPNLEDKTNDDTNHLTDDAISIQTLWNNRLPAAVIMSVFRFGRLKMARKTGAFHIKMFKDENANLRETIHRASLKRSPG